MYYVEFLRVLRALKVCAIVFAVVLAINGIIRIAGGSVLHNEFMKHFSSTAVRTVTDNPDGTRTVTLVDKAKGVRVVQNTGGPGGWDMTIFEDPSRAKHTSGHPMRRKNSTDRAPFVSINEYTLPNGVHVTHMKSDKRFPAELLVVFAGLLAAIFATIVGSSLSRENDGHLELTWTKPASRDLTALTMFGIDAIGIMAVYLLTVVFVEVCIAFYVGQPVITTTPSTTLHVAISLLFPLAWYALAQGLTASLRRHGGLTSGLMWVAAIFLPLILLIDNPILHTIVRAINTLNPLAYFGHLGANGGGNGMTLLPSSLEASTLALCAIIIIGIVASLVQWRRLEA